MIKKRTAISLIVLLVGMQLCGFSPFNNTTVAIDTDKNKVYRYITVDKIQNDITQNDRNSYIEYDDGYYLLSGIVDSVSKNGNKITIYGSDVNSKIVCSCKKEIQSDVIKYSPGENVALFGQLTIDRFDKECHLKADKIITAPTAIKSSEYFYTLSGKTFDYSKSKVKRLADNRVEYRIPSNWEQIEINIEENELGIIEGYQYVLNKIPGNENVDPESLFVCYFDKKLLKNASDIKNVKEVEKTIIDNIDGKVASSSCKTVKTYYDQKYRYYVGKYTNVLDSIGYRTEYVFIDDDNNGLVMFLYVYRDENYADDVIFLTRFLRVNN